MSGGQKKVSTDNSWRMSDDAKEKLNTTWNQLQTLWSESGRGGWFDQQIASMTPEQMNALGQLAQSDYLRNFASDLQSQSGDLISQGGAALQDLGSRTQQDFLFDANKLVDSQNLTARTNALYDRARTDAAKAATGIYGQAAGQGNVGSSRASLAAGQAASNITQQAAMQASNLEAQATQNALQQQMAMENQRANLAQNQLNTGAQLGQLGSNAMQQAIQNQLQSGSMSQQYNQYVLDVARQNQQGAWQQPWTNFGMYSQLAYPLLGMYGSEGTGTGTGFQGRSLVQSLIPFS